MQPAKLSYKIYQGTTFEETYRWETETKVYVPIDSISNTAPCVITTTIPHELPTGWRFRVVGAAGMKDINSTTDGYYIASETTTDTVTVNQVNSAGYAAYTTGGILEYNHPVPLTGYSARLQIRKTVASTEVLYDSTSAAGGAISIDTSNSTINITIPADVTAGFSFLSAVYSVELYDDTGRVIPFLTGNLTLVPEIIR